MGLLDKIIGGVVGRPQTTTPSAPKPATTNTGTTTGTTQAQPGWKPPQGQGQVQRPPAPVVQEPPKPAAPVEPLFPAFDANTKEPIAKDNNERLKFFYESGFQKRNNCCSNKVVPEAAWENFVKGGVDASKHKAWPPLPPGVMEQNLPPEQLKTIQADLNRVGKSDKDNVSLDSGKLDGKTVFRLMEYQQKKGLPVTGMADQKTVQTLAEQAGALRGWDTGQEQASALQSQMNLQSPGFNGGIANWNFTVDDAGKFKLDVSIARGTPGLDKIPKTLPNGTPINVKVYDRG